jgi:hypothetical protein
MPYQISRNGQMYGPYTLEDLQRYLASGNVLATDLAKSEEMTEWLPVSQILADTASAPAAASAAPVDPGFSAPLSSHTGYAGPDFGGSVYNPAAAQTASIAASPYPDAPNLHWGLYLLFAIITCTIFSKVFTVLQAAWLKKVQPNSNGLIFYAGLYVLWVISFFISAGRSMEIVAHRGAYPYHSTPGHGLLTIVYFILLIVTRFVMSASLEEHFNGPEPVGLQLNPVMVFFFGGVYFQYKLNEINEMKQAARYGAVRPY